ncbi:Uncharacterized protein dnm_043500 [Desulfonema magnum]|uniref:Uncharacterized protein n=1 Tax=Desulfonema magnum TaxID=45655 RepID=A0A975BN51_9BACT|nr:Uncharacterized protein dnm_043500 [Desulfonema magnum]
MPQKTSETTPRRRKKQYGESRRILSLWRTQLWLKILFQ